MSRGKYARKHSREKQRRAQEAQLSPLADEIFDDSFDFINKFKVLDTDTQIQIVRLLHDVVKKAEGQSSDGKGRQYAKEAEYFLKNIHKLSGCYYDTDVFYPLARDEKRLIRMECYGSINKRRDDELSFLFKYFRKNSKPHEYPQSAYKLLASPSWKVFHQFESFRFIEPDIRAYLHKSGLHPDALQVMTVSDFCEIIFQAYKTDNNAAVANFLPKEQCIKNRQNMDIMKYIGSDFEALLMKRCNADGKRIDGRVVKSYCDMMRRHGSDNVNSLIITERKYTKHILEGPAKKELMNYGIDVSKLQIGMSIPQDFIDYLVDHNMAELIMARNKQGKPLDKSGLPHLQDHHSQAVMLAHKEDTIAASNYPNKHICVDERIHQQYLHLFDKILHSGDNIEQIAARLNVQDKNMRVLLGFDAEKDALYCDMENNAKFRNRRAKDLKCKVNYFNMMQIRMQNEGKIIQKHNIPCSRSYVKEGYRNLSEIKNTEDYNREAMKQVEKLLKIQRIAKRKGKGR